MWKVKVSWKPAPAADRIIPTAVSKNPFFSHKANYKRHRAPLVYLIPSCSLLTAEPGIPAVKKLFTNKPQWWIFLALLICVFTATFLIVFEVLCTITHSLPKKKVLLRNTASTTPQVQGPESACVPCRSAVSDSFLTPDCNRQAPLSMEFFPGKDTGVGCHFLLWGNVPTPGIKPESRTSCTAGGFPTSECTGDSKCGQANDLLQFRISC